MAEDCTSTLYFLKMLNIANIAFVMTVKLFCFIPTTQEYEKVHTAVAQTSMNFNLNDIE